MTIPYFILSKALLSTFPIKQNLGHKFLGVEPDLLIDFFLLPPRIFLRTDLLHVQESDQIETLEAGYFTSPKRKLFQGFSLLRPQRTITTIQPLETGKLTDITQLDLSAIKKEQQPTLLKVKDHLDVLLIHHNFLKSLSVPAIRDIEFRLPK